MLETIQVIENFNTMLQNGLEKNNSRREHLKDQLILGPNLWNASNDGSSWEHVPVTILQQLLLCQTHTRLIQYNNIIYEAYKFLDERSRGNRKRNDEPVNVLSMQVTGVAM